VVHPPTFRPISSLPADLYGRYSLALSSALKEPLQKPTAMIVVQCLAGWIGAHGLGDEAVDADNHGI
jgi:hypothetical protein